MKATLSVRETSYQAKSTSHEANGLNVPILTVSGRLDASTVSILERVLIRTLLQGAQVVIVEMSGVTYISSSGLRILLSARRQARERGGDVLLSSLSSSVRDVLDMVGFTVLFSIYRSLDDAKRTLDRVD